MPQAGWDKYFESIESRFDRLEEKVDSIIAFKWQIIGGSVVISAILSVAIHFISRGWT